MRIDGCERMIRAGHGRIDPEPAPPEAAEAASRSP